MSDEFSPLHSHEPGTAPVLDAEGRCLVCSISVRDRRVAKLEGDVARLREIAAAAEAREATLRLPLVRAAKHDDECEEEGEGDCCLAAWRCLYIIAGLAHNVTPAEQILADALVA